MRPGLLIFAVLVFIYTFYALAEKDSIESSGSKIAQAERIHKAWSTTCSGRCGQSGYERLLTCSCAVSCLVYDTCCENITQDCPHVVSEGQAMIAPYLLSDKMCGTNVFKITSCAAGSNNTDDFYVDVELEISERPGDRTTLSAEEIHRALLYAPVTDSKSGFTFLNSFVYNCYTQFGTTAKPLSWSLRLENDQTGTYEFSNSLDVQTDTLYIPPVGELLYPHVCVKDVVDSCDDVENNYNLTQNELSFLAAKCKEFTMYVVGRKNRYRNPFCAFCHEGIHDKFTHQRSFSQKAPFHDYSILMALDNDGTVKLQALSKYQPAWRTATCPNLDAILTSQTSDMIDAYEREDDVYPSCKISACSTGYAFRSDGRCKRTQYSVIGFSGPPNSTPLRCVAAIHRIAGFLTCSLHLLIDIGPMKYAEFSAPEAYVSLDGMLGKTLYVVQLKFASSGDYTYPYGPSMLSYKRNETVPNLHKLAVSVKAAYKYTHDQDLCLVNDIDDITYEYDLDLVPSGTFSLDDMVKLRGPIIERNTTVTICAAQATTNPHFGTFCFEDFVYQEDEVHVARLLKSSCTDFLDKDKTPPTFPLGSYHTLTGHGLRSKSSNQQKVENLSQGQQGRALSAHYLPFLVCYILPRLY